MREKRESVAEVRAELAPWRRLHGGREYAYLYGALLKEGIPADAALAWLERVKRAGFRSRFTLAESRQTSVLEGLKSGS